MTLLVTTEENTQFLIERERMTYVDELGRPTKAQCTMTVLPIVKPGLDLIIGDEHGAVTNFGKITGVIYRR